MNLPGQEWELSGLEWVWTNRTVTRVSYIFEDSGTESSWVVIHIVAANPEEAHEYQQAAAVEEMTRVAEGESLAFKQNVPSTSAYVNARRRASLEAS